MSECGVPELVSAMAPPKTRSPNAAVTVLFEPRASPLLIVCVHADEFTTSPESVIVLLEIVNWPAA